MKFLLKQYDNLFTISIVKDLKDGPNENSTVLVLVNCSYSKISNKKMSRAFLKIVYLKHFLWGWEGDVEMNFKHLQQCRWKRAGG